MAGKFDEYCVWTDDESSLKELDAEHFGQSVRERIDIAVRAKVRRQLPSRYFYDAIEEAADDFLVEGQAYPENQQRLDEIQTAYNELLPAFRLLKEHVKDDRTLDNAIRDVMWSSFLIGLACDRERLGNPEILERYSSSVAGRARAKKKESQDKWGDAVYKAVCLAIPTALKAQKKFIKAVKTTKAAENLYDYVVDELVKAILTEKAAGGEQLDEKTRSEPELNLKSRVKERLKLAAVRKAMGRYIDENGKMDVSSSGVPAQNVS